MTSASEPKLRRMVQHLAWWCTCCTEAANFPGGGCPGVSRGSQAEDRLSPACPGRLHWRPAGYRWTGGEVIEQAMHLDQTAAGELVEDREPTVLRFVRLAAGEAAGREAAASTSQKGVPNLALYQTPNGNPERQTRTPDAPASRPSARKQAAALSRTLSAGGLP